MTTTSLDNVFAYIVSNQQASIDRLIDYVRRPSISAHGVGIAEVAAFLVDLLGGLGMAVEAIPTAGWPMILAERNDAPGKPTVLIYGHYDVQPVDPLNLWKSDPFQPEIRS